MRSRFENNYWEAAGVEASDETRGESAADAHTAVGIESLSRHVALGTHASHLSRLFLGVTTSVAGAATAHSALQLQHEQIALLLEPQAWAWLVQTLPSLVSLAELSLRNARIGDKRCHQLLRVGAPFAMLAAALGLAGAKGAKTATPGINARARVVGGASSAVAAASADEMLFLPSLVRADFSGNALSFRSAAILGRFALRHAGTLRELRLSHNELQDHGVQVLSVYVGKLSPASVVAEPHQFHASLVKAVRAQQRLAHARRPRQERSDTVAIGVGLTTLDVSANRCTMRGVADALQGAAHASQLRRLLLRDNVPPAEALQPSFSSFAERHFLLAGADRGRPHPTAAQQLLLLLLADADNSGGGAPAGSFVPFASFAELPRFAALTHLDLSGAPVGALCSAAGVHELLLSVLFASAGLRVLDLSDTFVDLFRGGAAASAEMVDAAARRQVRVGDVVAQLFYQVARDAAERRGGSVPPSFGTLQQLLLGRSGLSDEGAALLRHAALVAEAGRSGGDPAAPLLCGALRRLDASGNFLTANGALALLDALSRGALAALALLRLDGNEHLAHGAAVAPDDDGETREIAGQGIEVVERAAAAAVQRRARSAAAAPLTVIVVPPLEAAAPEPQHRPASAANPPIVDIADVSAVVHQHHRAAGGRGAAAMTATTPSRTFSAAFASPSSTFPVHHAMPRATEELSAGLLPGTPRVGVAALVPWWQQQAYRGDGDERHNLSNVSARSFARGPLMSPAFLEDDDAGGDERRQHGADLRRRDTETSGDGGGIDGTAGLASSAQPSPIRATSPSRRLDDSVVAAAAATIAGGGNSNSAGVDPAASEVAAAPAAVAVAPAPEVPPSTADTASTTGDAVAVAAAAPPRTAAEERAAERKAKLAANRARRRKVLGGGLEGEDALLAAAEEAAAAAPEPAPRRDNDTAAAPADAPPPQQQGWRFSAVGGSTDAAAAVAHPLEIVEESPAAAPAEAAGPPPGLDRAPTEPPAAASGDPDAAVAADAAGASAAAQPQPRQLLEPDDGSGRRLLIARDPALLSGRVKTFTLTYAHPAGHVLCRAWRALSADPAARLALEQDALRFLQPDGDGVTGESATKVVERVAVAIGVHDEGVASFNISTNERRAAVAQRLQEACNDAAGEGVNFFALRRYLADRSSSSGGGGDAGDDEFIGGVCGGERDFLAYVRARVARLGPRASLGDAYPSVEALVHDHHGREEALIAELPPDTAASSEGGPAAAVDADDAAAAPPPPPVDGPPPLTLASTIAPEPSGDAAAAAGDLAAMNKHDSIVSFGASVVAASPRSLPGETFEAAAAAAADADPAAAAAAPAVPPPSELADAPASAPRALRFSRFSIPADSPSATTTPRRSASADGAAATMAFDEMVEARRRDLAARSPGLIAPSPSRRSAAAGTPPASLDAAAAATGGTPRGAAAAGGTPAPLSLSKLLDPAHQPPQQPPPLWEALADHRMRSLFKLCHDAMQLGEVPLRPASRNKVRVCRGVWSGERVTVSVEWDALLVVKYDHGLGVKQLAAVHPVCVGATFACGGGDDAPKGGDELVMTLETPFSPEELAAAPAAAPSSGAAATPAAAANSDAAAQRAMRRRVTVVAVRLDSHKRVERALATLEECARKALDVVSVLPTAAEEARLQKLPPTRV